MTKNDQVVRVKIVSIKIVNLVVSISMLSEVEVYYRFSPSFFAHPSTSLRKPQVQCSGNQITRQVWIAVSS